MLKKSSHDGFFARVREYLPIQCVIRTVEEDGSAGSVCGLQELSENAFFLFDGESLLALSHALEDMALEEAAGSLIATFPDADRFEPQRERYWQLAATLDEVEVLVGNRTRRNGRTRVRQVSSGLCRHYWIVLYEGPKFQGVVVARQLKDGSTLGARNYEGFVSFNESVVRRVRQNLQKGCDKSGELQEFVRLRHLDRVVKQTRVQFVRENDALEKAMRRLQLDGERYRVQDFTANVQRSFARLGAWKDRLCDLAQQPVAFSGK